MRPRGEFWCVANAFLPYERVLAAQWSSVTAVATNGSYTVWRATGRPSRVSLGAEYQ
jgi:16S rRNA G1207 methylase RsmC